MGNMVERFMEEVILSLEKCIISVFVKKYKKINIFVFRMKKINKICEFEKIWRGSNLYAGLPLFSQSFKLFR